MATFSRTTWHEADAAWRDGEFGSEWRRYRELAASRGFLYPPMGSRHDSWEDQEPSQRAIVYRAIEDTPKLLERCIGSSRSWSEVVERLIAAVGEWRDEIARREAEDRRRREADDPTRRQAAESLGDILRRVGS